MRSRLLSAVACALAFPVLAQGAEDAPYDPTQFDVAHGKEVFEHEGICVQCHGWDGAGRGRNPRAPTGANLRETPLDHAMLREVVACGRPDTDMPYHDDQAYSDGRCFGLTEADFSDGRMPARGHTLDDEEIDDLVAYLVTAMVGQGPSTLADCEAFYRPGHRNCRGLK